jgi:hypothetical protein
VIGSERLTGHSYNAFPGASAGVGTALTPYESPTIQTKLPRTFSDKPTLMPSIYAAVAALLSIEWWHDDARVVYNQGSSQVGRDYKPGERKDLPHPETETPHSAAGRAPPST